MSRKLTLFERKKIAGALREKYHAKGIVQKKVAEAIQHILIEATVTVGSDPEETQASRQPVRIDQGFISKVLAARIPTLNVRMIAVCKYVDIFDIICTEVPLARTPTPKLLDALGYAWDGTAYQEKWLCRLLRAINKVDDAREPHPRPSDASGRE